MKKKTTHETGTPIEREGVRLLAIELGAGAAARKLGLNYNTVRSWAKRDNWNLPVRGGRPAIVPATDLQRPGDILLQEHKALETTTKTALMQTAAKAATDAAQKPPLEVSNTSQFRDVATAAAHLFGWDAGKGASVTLNQLVVTTEQLQQIRALREQADAQECSSDTPGCP
jgi:molybdenum-dependent DNA-binding transcriptional regulator ModE